MPYGHPLHFLGPCWSRYCAWLPVRHPDVGDVGPGGVIPCHSLPGVLVNNRFCTVQVYTHLVWLGPSQQFLVSALKPLCSTEFLAAKVNILLKFWRKKRHFGQKLADKWGFVNSGRNILLNRTFSAIFHPKPLFFDPNWWHLIAEYVCLPGELAHVAAGELPHLVEVTWLAN